MTQSIQTVFPRRTWERVNKTQLVAISEHVSSKPSFMSLKFVLNKVLQEYSKASQLPFKGSSFNHYLRNEVPRTLKKNLELPEVYQVKASSGNGGWATVPWIAIFNKVITTVVTDGFFCVYLFHIGGNGVYLSLNQGVSQKKKALGLPGSRDFVKTRAAYYREVLDLASPEKYLQTIDLGIDLIPKSRYTTRRLPRAYEAGNIYAKFYQKESLPTPETLRSDLKEMLDLYWELFEKIELDKEKDGDVDSTNFPREDKGGTQHFHENPKQYSFHRRIERNQSLVQAVKKEQGYTCKACGFNFSDFYGEIGDGFIEAHHIKPLSSLTKERVKLDPNEDFAVLCSNCHRMIHKISPIPNISEFIAITKIVSHNPNV